MSGITKFAIGSTVRCTDGTCGELRRVIIDPLKVTVTHLVVEPRHRKNKGHLVPIKLVDSSGTDITLSCTKAHFHELEEAEEAQFIPGPDGQWGYGAEQTGMLPYYGLRAPGIQEVGGTGPMGLPGGQQKPLMKDRVPVDEVEIKRGDAVHSRDGAIGRIEGLVVDGSDHHVTHILLAEGHPWGRKRVAIPMSVVSLADDWVRVDLSEDQIGELPPVEVDLHG